MDILSLNIRVEPDETQGATIAYVEIAINAIVIVSGNDFPVDIYELHNSIDIDGHFNFWTCHCGIPACADIVVAISVEHTDNLVRWNNIDLPFLSGVEYVFDQNLYSAAISGCIKELKNVFSLMSNNNAKFEFYPDPKFIRIEDLLD